MKLSTGLIPEKNYRPNRGLSKTQLYLSISSRTIKSA